MKRRFHNWSSIGALLGSLAVILGAFGAHAFEARLALRETTDIFETAQRYHLAHAIVLLVISLLERSGMRLRMAAHAFLWGITVFSGTLYVLALTGPRWLGAITPIGGVLLIVGWLLLAFAAGSSPPRRLDEGGDDHGSAA